MNNYFFCDNTKETLNYLTDLGWENCINTDSLNEKYLMCFFNTGTRNHIFAIGLFDANTRKQEYVSDVVSFINRHTVLSSLGMSLQEIIDTCKE